MPKPPNTTPPNNQPLSGSIVPNECQFQQLMELNPAAGPLVMINCLRYLDTAQYPDDKGEPACSGRDAYQRYAELAFPSVMKLGAKPVWMAEVLHCFVAPDQEQWDDIILIQWPSLDTFKQLMSDEDYHQISYHRDAALADSRLIIARTQLADF